jgi:hypothetical protein
MKMQHVVTNRNGDIRSIATRTQPSGVLVLEHCYCKSVASTSQGKLPRRRAAVLLLIHFRRGSGFENEMICLSSILSSQVLSDRVIGVAGQHYPKTTRILQWRQESVTLNGRKAKPNMSHLGRRSFYWQRNPNITCSRQCSRMIPAVQRSGYFLGCGEITIRDCTKGIRKDKWQENKRHFRFEVYRFLLRCYLLCAPFLFGQSPFIYLLYLASFSYAESQVCSNFYPLRTKCFILRRSFLSISVSKVNLIHVGGWDSVVVHAIKTTM